MPAVTQSALLLGLGLFVAGPAPAPAPAPSPLPGTSLPAPPGAGAAAESPAEARYRFRGTAPWRVVVPREAAGYRLVLSSSDGSRLEARVEVDSAAVDCDALLPLAPVKLPEDARAVLASPGEASLALDQAARSVLGGADTVLEAVRRVVDFTSRRIRYVAPDGDGETAARTLVRGRGSCVGRSLLAAELLRRAGIPARQVTGVLAASAGGDLTPDTRPFFSETLGGVRHRWIEAWVPGLGWVPSDPGGIPNRVSARHVALAAPPGRDFGVEVLGR